MLDNKLFISYDFPAPLKYDEVIDYIKKAHNGDLEAREMVIKHNMRLVLNVVLKKFNNTPYDSEELVAVGILGLIKSVDTFDIEKNIKFSTYAGKCINNEIGMFIKKEKKHLYKESLNCCLKSDSEENELLLEDILVDETVDFVSDFEKDCTNKIVRELVNKLPDRDREIVSLYFGFTGDKRYTQNEIAKKINISSQSYVGRLIKKNLKKIKEELIQLGIVDETSEKEVRKMEEKIMPRKIKKYIRTL